MLSDDTFTARLQETIAALTAWGESMRDAARVDVAEAPSYWRIIVTPHAAGAAPLQLLLTAERTFSIRIGGETYSDKPIDDFEFFGKVARAVERGDVALVETRNGLTGQLATIETRIDLGDGWAWVGERRIDTRAQRGGMLVAETKQYLPYRR